MASPPHSEMLDEFLPHYDFVERHSTVVRAAPDRIYAAIRRADLARHPITRALLKLRGLKAVNLDTLLRDGFGLLAEDPPREIVLGVQGPFWKPACRLHTVTPETFRDPVPKGAARAAWNFRIESDGRVTTETRILCADDARLKFRMYWMIVRPFSGVIRRMMLRAIREEAER